MNKIQIELSDEIMEEFNRDRFKETLERTAFDVREGIKDKNSINMAGNYEAETLEALITAFQNAEVVE